MSRFNPGAIDEAGPRDNRFTWVWLAMIGVTLAATAFLSELAVPYPTVKRDTPFLPYPALWGVALLAAIVTVHPLARWLDRHFVSPDGFSNYWRGIFGVSPFLLIFFVVLGLVLNGRLDRSAPTAYETVVLNKRIVNPRKKSPWHDLQLRDWRDARQMIHLPVSKTQYEGTTIGSSLRIVTKSGWLGYEWRVSPN